MVSVTADIGQDTFQCCECSGNADVDSGEATVTPWLKAGLTVDMADGKQLVVGQAATLSEACAV